MIAPSAACSSNSTGDAFVIGAEFFAGSCCIQAVCRVAVLSRVHCFQQAQVCSVSFEADPYVFALFYNARSGAEAACVACTMQ